LRDPLPSLNPAILLARQRGGGIFWRHKPTPNINKRGRNIKLDLTLPFSRVLLLIGSDARNTPLNGKLSRRAHISMEVKEFSQNYCRFPQQIPNKASEANLR